ncbi:MAG: NAD-dependent epimerase [Candidatus Nanopelagicales bacterium]
MSTHTIVGAGQVGTRLAHLLLARGYTVRLLSRTGNGPQGLQADASDLASLRSAASGSDVIYNCLNPRYHRWPVGLAADGRQPACVRGSRGGSAGDLEQPVRVRPGHGRDDRTDADGCGHTVKGGVRARMWQQALAAHDEGRIRTVEVRASDYIGEGGGQVMFGERVVPNVRAGKTVRVLGAADQPHTWTYTGDVATTLAGVATDESTWGRAWHVPSNAPRTQTEVVGDLAAALGLPAPRVRPLPATLVRIAGLFNPEIREMREMLYEFDRPFVMDSSAAQTELGLKPTPWDEVIEETLRRNPA